MEFYIWDEPNFIKKWVFQQTKIRYELVIQEDYFVGNHFGIPTQPFKVVDNILYQGFKGSLMQKERI